MIIFKRINEKCTIGQENAVVERHEEQFVQQQVSAVLTTIFSAGKRTGHTLKQCD